MEEKKNNNEDINTPESSAEEETAQDVASAEEDAVPSEEAAEAADTHTDAEQEEEEKFNSNFSFDDEEDDDFVSSESSPSPSPSFDNYFSAPSDVIYEQRRRHRRKRQAFFSKLKAPLIIILIILAGAFAGLFAYGLVRIPDDRILDNVYIEDLEVGGMTYEEAIEAIKSSYMFEDTNITLLCGDKNFTISGNDIGLIAIPEESAQKAFNYCKSGNIIKDGIGSVKLLLSKHVIMPAARVDNTKLDEKINEFGNSVLGERRQHSVEIGDNNTATITSGQTGYNMQPSVARSEIMSAFDKEQFTNIYVSFENSPPEDMTIERFDALVYKDPVNAHYEVNGNSVEVVPEENGRYINKEEAAPLLQNVYEGCEPVQVPFYTSEASVKAQTLKDKLFSATLASYSTSYGSSTSNRCANIARAASLINGTVIAPGGIFSFNNTVGRRSAENGFYTAKEYVNGESVDGIGGGTCQVSSTLYSAVLYADMDIVERLNHMMTVGYIPLGQDATVSDGGVDFKFKNSSEYPVKISASTSGATITISIIGTAWEPQREVKITNSTSQSGKNTVVYSKRHVYAGGELISTDTLNSSTYMPHPTPKPEQQ